jgi:hypothetical protein
MFDLPQPFGPTTPEIPSPKVSTTRSPKDLKPWISNRLIRIQSDLEATERHASCAVTGGRS